MPVLCLILVFIWGKILIIYIAESIKHFNNDGTPYPHGVDFLGHFLIGWVIASSAVWIFYLILRVFRKKPPPGWM